MPERAWGVVPDVGRRIFIENGPVKPECLQEPVVVSCLFRRAALGRVMVEFSAEDLFTEFIPVVLRVKQVLVPYLVDHIRRRGAGGGDTAKVHEAAVFCNGPAGEAFVPAVFPGELS